MKILMKPGATNVEIARLTNEQEEEVLMRTLVFAETAVDQVIIGPFDQQEWDELLEYLQNPEEVAARQKARAAILARQPEVPPLQTIPRG